MPASNHNSRIPRRILVVRLGSMGDVIHALPAVAALREIFPGVEVGWVIEERWSELLCSAGGQPRSPQMPLVDRVHIVNTRAWRQSLGPGKTWRQIWDARRELRQTGYDIALDFQGAWKSAAVALASGAPVRLGFLHPREQSAALFYNRKIDGAGAHVVEQNLSLLAGLIPRDGDTQWSTRLSALQQSPPAPQLPRDERQEAWAGEELANRGFVPHDFAILNPGAGWGAKCWAAESYGEVARGLAKLGLPTFVNFGPREEALAQAVVKASGGVAFALQSSLSQLIALMRRARIFVGGDTGPMHLAAALRIPVVGIFGPTDPERNGPFAADAVVLRHSQSVTNHSRRAKPDDAMLSISPAEVLDAAHSLLERDRSPIAGNLEATS
jgi:heptosyltransferase-1